MKQRSTLNFWLLLAATIAVDAVVMSWQASASGLNQLYPAIAFLGLVVSQLGLVCIWSALSESRSLWIRFAPVPVAVAAALANALSYASPSEFRESFVSQFAFFGFYAALVTIALWLLQRTRFWHRQTGASRPLQFSVANLLVAMTVVAILVPFLRRSEIIGSDELWIDFAVLCSAAVIAVASVMIWSLNWFWLLRLAAVLGIALLLASAVLFVFTQGDPAAEVLTLTIAAINLIQALVLSIWLASGYIIPTRADGASGGTRSQSEPTSPA